MTDNLALLHPAEPLGAKAAGALCEKLTANIERVVRGKREAVELALTAIIARGHLLIEDVPGVGKTTLAQALARSLDLSFSRIQFTSDLLPADILGVSVYDGTKGAFDFKPGPIFANLILADEINRTTPRTQSCLLEAMGEGRVSMDGVTRALPQPFSVIATQNPHEHAGTFPLPESQLDRFLLRVTIGYPAADVERRLLISGGAEDDLGALEPVANAETLAALQSTAQKVRVPDEVADYALRLCEATRASPAVALGVSTRGAIALVRAAQAWACSRGRDFVAPDDVKRLASSVLAHRIVPAGSEGGAGRSEAARIVADLAERIAVPA